MTQRNETIRSLRDAFIAKTDTPSAALARALRNIATRDGEVHAYLEVYEDAREAALAADQAYERGEYADRPLLGVPIALKNNILMKGKRATAGSRMLENYIATYDATVTKRLVDAGAIIVGATNLDEFAMGSSTENSAFGPTKNPLDTSRVPGGSSGGSAAAVAMGSVPAALGTDTGGSIRLPASFCGLVGVKPTYGRVSRSGLIAMGSSLDQAGPFAHTVSDARTILEIIQGEDALDATTYRDQEYPEVPVKQTYRIGIPRAFMKGIEPDVLKVFEAAEAQLRADGHEIVDVELPMMEEGLAAYYIVMPAEVSSNLARYDGVRYGLHIEGKDLITEYGLSRAAGFGKEVKRRILLGTYVLSSGYYDAYYGRAERIRAVMRAELASVFTTVDCILTPTAPMPAFRVGEKSDPLSMYLTDIFTVPANLTGVPAISVPAGTVDRDGSVLPIGIQFMAPHNGENRLFDIAERFVGE
jgi:aspartyl-tRNA(Asn)/glutamyl-tRNA(Gln) amidotransferase subunit A